jgi:hypothetical protein
MSYPAQLNTRRKWKSHHLRRAVLSSWQDEWTRYREAHIAGSLATNCVVAILHQFQQEGGDPVHAPDSRPFATRWPRTSLCTLCPVSYRFTSVMTSVLRQSTCISSARHDDDILRNDRGRVSNVMDFLYFGGRQTYSISFYPQPEPLQARSYLKSFTNA